MGFLPPSVHACLCHLHRGHATAGQETRRPGQLPLCPSWGQRPPPATLGEWTLAPSAGRKRRQTRGQTGERLSYGRSGCSLVGRWGRSLWSLANAGAYCRGFSRADPDTSSGETGRNGRAGRDHALPGHPPSFQSFGQGSPGRLWGLTQPPWAPRKRRPGKWDTSGWPSTTCRHTWCGTHGCRGGPGAAAAPQNH